jgi:hypothetical protein
MIPMLGQGWLYQLHRNKAHFLTRAERKRAMLFLCGITACVTTTILLWLLR